MADQPELWGFKRTARIVVPATLAIGLVAFLMFSRGEQLKVSKARGGECIIAPTSTVVNVLQKRDCDDPHNAEIVAAFEYPANPAEGEPTPEETCTLLPPDLPPDELAIAQRVLAILDDAGYPNMIVTNNADSTKKRDYVCLVTFPTRTGSFGDDIIAQATGTALPGG
jgi:hypothetical protein